MQRTEELDVAVEAARAGGAIVARCFHEGIGYREKEGAGLVTDADTGSEEAIAAIIRKAFPGHALLGEEAHHGDTRAEHVWVVDPLDGTTNFAHGIPHCAVSIAYWRQGRAVCGVVYNPLREDWYLASRGGGAFYNGHRAHVGPQTRLDDVLVATGFYYDRGAMMEATLATVGDLFRLRIHGMRRLGTAALDLCMVGTGPFGAFFEYRLSPWDFAAGCLFVEEAGGRVTTCRGEPLSLRPTSVLASNGPLHDAMLESVAARAPAVER